MVEGSDEVDGDIGNIYRPTTQSASPRLPEVCVTDMEEEEQDLFPMTDFGTPRSVKIKRMTFRVTRNLSHQI